MGLGAVSKYVVGYLTYIIVHWRNSHDNESHMFVESANFAFLVLYVLYGVEYTFQTCSTYYYTWQDRLKVFFGKLGRSKKLKKSEKFNKCLPLTVFKIQLFQFFFLRLIIKFIF